MKSGIIRFMVLIHLILALWLLSGGVGSAEVSPAGSGIPVVSITLDPQEYESAMKSPDHSYRTAGGFVRIDLPEGYQSPYGVADPGYIGIDLPLEYLRGRGTSSWLPEKKSFKLKLRKKADFLGMGKTKHWVLVSDCFDPSLLRNRIMYGLGSLYGMPYTPRILSVDVYLNGEYLGNYTLGQIVRIEDAGIAIDEIPQGAETGDAVTGGYLLAMAPYPDELPANTFRTDRGVRFLLKEPAFADEDPYGEIGCPAQRDYITGYLQDTENAIFNGDAAWMEYMDMESAAKYWWLQQLSVNGDAFRSDSNYLYKPKGGKLFWGPLWDFDISMNPAMYNDAFNYIAMPWLDYLRANSPVFREALQRTWSELDPILEEITSDGGMIDRYADEIRASWVRNNALWHTSGQTDETGLDTQVTELKQFIRMRRASIIDHLDQLGEVAVTVAPAQPRAAETAADAPAIPGRAPDDLAGGISGTCYWRIDARGHMTIGPLDGRDGTLGHWTVAAERPWHPWMLSITGVSFRGTVHPQTCLALFYHCYNLKEIDLTGLDTSGVQMMRGMFAWCWNLETLDVSGLNTSSATSMREMFLGCNRLNALDLSGFDFTHTTDTRNMFYRCHHLKHILLPKTGASEIADMSGMFADCHELQSLDLSGFDTSRPTCMRAMFFRCFALKALNLSGLDTSRVTDMDFMFAECHSLTGLNLADFRTDSVTDMRCMFLACSNLASLDLSGFDFSRVKCMDDLCKYCPALEPPSKDARAARRNE